MSASPTKRNFSLVQWACLTLLAIPSAIARSDDASKQNLRGTSASKLVAAQDQQRRELFNLVKIADDVSNGSLGRCEGDCDGDENCSGDLVCFKRDGATSVPGCGGDHSAELGMDYCIRRQDHPDYQGQGGSGFKLGHCQGDCDSDADCEGNLVCKDRTRNMFISECPNSVNDSSVSDYCVNPPTGNDKVNSNTSTRSSSKVPRVVSSSTAWNGGGDFSLGKPVNMRAGDLLVMVLARSDDLCPARWNGWKTTASCFKDDNADATCNHVSECTEWDGAYCKTFRNNRKGLDLAATVLTRVATQNDVDNWNLPITMRHSHPGWGSVMVVRDAASASANPVRGVATRSCDAVREAVFPSVEGAVAGDLLLAVMANDDAVMRTQYTPPAGMEWATYVVGHDETTAAYQQTLTRGGPTGERTTTGSGHRGRCKDALISLVVRAS